ncbi:helix-turn-helix domain-containing protein [Flammeovirga yaeyamensis]|uniref:Helix-turn-helix domain-containing protein n=1 Tax=Flammeovirga yaeyamensis TaxID=367791 RepID=A0AAX1N6F7_9BACT|nr:AraC family transcriptional regulator [Flammeovirga yaeyamensis]MBB3697647.1 YesN/AraC family two-component response regulator [Flammeovirga yaeyamensis]NMF35993.1 AraC family transcriptional regulator [Flammeovirga yaeyamensis]QWG03061.1 helix-turn-helix domain-containing protein [Flammeovirga yaeyamensis]
MKAILEKVITQDESTLRAFKYTNERFVTPWHLHPEYELTYIIKSTGSRYVGNNVSDYQPGELVLIGPNLPHCWKDDSTHEDNVESLVLQWPKELIEPLFSFSDIKYAFKNVERGILFKNADSLKIKEKMLAIIEANHWERYAKFIALLGEMNQLNEREILAGESYSYESSKDTNNRIEVVQNFVEQNFSRKIKLSEIAEELSMTEQSFSRFFSKNMQRPFFVYLNEYRINRVSRLLLETDMQVAEIGYTCGYESLPFFYQQFKKFKGYSPLGFRKMYRSTLEKL